MTEHSAIVNESATGTAFDAVAKRPGLIPAQVPAQSANGLSPAKKRSLSPRQAIHKFCIDCQGSAVEATRCYTQACPLWHDRRGKRDPHAPLTPVKAVRQYCRYWCVDNSIAAVRDCEITNCPLHPFRLGKNPNRRRGRTQ